MRDVVTLRPGPAPARTEAGQPTVAAVVVHWNSAPDTLRCLDALRGSDYRPLETIVVDNGSTSDARASLRRSLPANAMLIEHPTNLGFTGGYNRGLRHAFERGADYALLVNDDAVVDPAAVGRLVEAAMAHPDAALLGPLVLALEAPDVILSAGGELRDGWYPVHRGLGERDAGRYGRPAEVDFVSGCAILVARAAAEAIGLLDDGFFAYYEDVDWGLRARRAGYCVRFVPQARVLHPDTRPRDGDSAAVTYYLARNQLRFIWKHRLGPSVMARHLGAQVRTLASWSSKPRWRSKRRQRDALARALFDFARGYTGAAPAGLER